MRAAAVRAGCAHSTRQEPSSALAGGASAHAKRAAPGATVSHALSGAGAAVGGADFDPRNKSEAEIQRFCQSFMTELQKYVGPGLDLPSMGVNCGSTEIGYMYGQYKRTTHSLSKHGFGMLWGGSVPHPEVHGYGPVSFAKSLTCSEACFFVETTSTFPPLEIVLCTCTKAVFKNSTV